MRNIFLAMTSNRFGVLEYGKVLFLFLLMSVCFVSSLTAGKVGQASLPNITKTSGDACPTKEELITKTRTLQMPFIANNGQVDEQVMFYAKTFGGTVFVTKEGEIVYSLPEVRGRDVPDGASRQDVGAQGRREAQAQGRKAVFGWHGQALLVRAESELVANGYLPFFRTDNANCPPDRVLAKSLLAAYLPGLQKEETTQRVVSTLSMPLHINPGFLPANYNPQSKIQNSKSEARGVTLRETILGAKIGGITGEQSAVTTVNYFTGNDKSKWKTNIPTYNIVNLGEVYKGVELSLKAYGDNMEKLFCVKPGANPEVIKIQLDGVKDCGMQSAECGIKNTKSEFQNPKLQINDAGELVAETELGPVNFTKPVAYQEIDGKRVEVACEYTIAECVKNLEFRFWNLDCFPYSAFRISTSTNSDFKIPQSKIKNPKFEYGFTVASYDKTKDLIIDPLLASTFLGGGNSDAGQSLALDTSGNVYVTGSSYFSKIAFPTTIGAYDTSFNGDSYHDVFVSKLNSGLTSLLASTFLGGSASSEEGYSLALDTSGNVYVTGYTESSNFPTTSGAYDTSYNGGINAGDVFVSKLNSGLTSLLASTFLGGYADDFGNSLILDTVGDVFVTGSTKSADFPLTNGAYGTSTGGGSTVFVSKLDSGLTSLLASTFLGRGGEDRGNSLALDTDGYEVYVTGTTYSSSFPTTIGAYGTSTNGGQDVFVSKLSSGLTTLRASTFLGGSGYDYGYSLTLDTSGNVYVTGETYSTNFPTTIGAYDTSFNGGTYHGDVFVSKLNRGLTSLLASTYQGGSLGDASFALTLDTSGNVYVTGTTYSTDFPTTRWAYDTTHNGPANGKDVFVSKLDGRLTSLLESTFLGGTGFHEEGDSLALDTSGNI